MPRRKQRRRRRRRRNNRRKYPILKPANAITSVPKAQSILVHHGLGMPNAFLTKLRFSQTFRMNTSAYEERVYRANSINDPQFAIGGTQPMYRDELTAIYADYLVYASSIDVKYLQTTNTGENAFIKAGVYPLAKDGGTAIILDAGTERDRCKFGLMGPNSGGNGELSMTNYLNVVELFGLRKNSSDDAQFVSIADSQPSSEALWHCFAGSLDGVSVVSVYVVVNITYYVKFFTKKAVARS